MNTSEAPIYGLAYEQDARATFRGLGILPISLMGKMSVLQWVGHPCPFR